MKYYKIISFVKNIGPDIHIYAVRRAGGQETGDYHCTTLNDTKIESDFCCEPNAYIDSIKCINTNQTFAIRDITNLGSVERIRLNRARGEIKILGREGWNDIATLTIQRPIMPQAINTNNQEMAKTAVKTAAKVTAAAPSRSQVKKEDPFKSLQAIIEKQPDLRLAKFFKRDLPSTVKEFLINFFTKYNAAHATILVSNKTEQTSTGRRRSIGDLFKICQYYYPNVTLGEVAKLLFVGLQAHFKTGFRYSYCSTVKKRVFYYAAGDTTYEENKIKDEYGHMVEYYKDKF